MQILRLILLFLVAGTGVNVADEIDELRCVDVNRLQTPGSDFIVKSIRHAFHGGNQVPENAGEILCLSRDQFSLANNRYSSLSTDARAKLDALYLDISLRMMALRDSDGDNILDFRIKEQGSFIQNDTDADNDGIDNLFDSNPLSANTTRDRIEANDHDNDGLPDYLDWSNPDFYSSSTGNQKSTNLIAIQDAIFNDFEIVLIEGRGSLFTEALAEMTFDVLQLFRKMIRKYDAGNTVKSITLEDQYDVDPSDVLAEVSPVNGQILIFEFGVQELDVDPVNLISPFMVYIHEFAHVIQNAMDYPENQSDLLGFNAHTQALEFSSESNRLGWQLTELDPIPSVLNSGYVEHGNEIITVNEIYRNTDLQEIKRVCEEEWTDLSQQKWELFNIVNCYSLEGVREWHADYVAVTVLTEMYKRLRRKFGLLGSDMIARSQEKMSQDWGEPYDYENADQQVINAISRDIGISRSLLDRLNQKYLVEPFGQSADIFFETPQRSR